MSYQVKLDPKAKDKLDDFDEGIREKILKRIRKQSRSFWKTSYRDRPLGFKGGGLQSDLQFE